MRVSQWRDGYAPASMFRAERMVASAGTTESDVSEWNHNLCTNCWCETRSYEHDQLGTMVRTPVRLKDTGVWLPVVCCRCGRMTTSGIMVREDPNLLPCKGEHGTTYEDAIERGGVFARQLPQEAGGDMSITALRLKSAFQAVEVQPTQEKPNAVKRRPRPRKAVEAQGER